jgi:hypothetical protein
MKIIVENEEERTLIVSLCDVALKANGVQNLKPVNAILASVVEEKKENVERTGNSV